MFVSTTRLVGLAHRPNHVFQLEKLVDYYNGMIIEECD